jgi:hypothetical protein
MDDLEKYDSDDWGKMWTDEENLKSVMIQVDPPPTFTNFLMFNVPIISQTN